jgi:hypothetical protein
VLQALGGGAVALAHAAEAPVGAVRLESHHSAACVKLHDPATCTLCQYAGNGAHQTPVQLLLSTDPALPFAPTRNPEVLVVTRDRPIGGPRAPPSLLS